MKRALLASAALGLIVPAAAAQAADEPRIEETIIVTLPGPDRAADELIGPASVRERPELLDGLGSSLGDSLADKPGLSSTAFGQGASRPVVRGLGAERVLVATNGLGVLDASAASPDHQVAADGIDAARVEVLRGPAALAYGGQAIGGVVNVIDGLIVERSEPGVSGDAYFAYNTVNDGAEGGLRLGLGQGPFALSFLASGRDFGDLDIPGMAESERYRALEEEEHHDHDDHDEDHEHDHEGEAAGVLDNSFLTTRTLGLGASYVGARGFFGVSVREQASDYGLPGHAHEHGEEDHSDDHGEAHDDDHDEEHDEEAEGEEESPFIDFRQTRVDVRGGLELDGFFTRLTGAAAFADYEHTEFEAPGEPGTVFQVEGHEVRVEAEHAPVAGFSGAFVLSHTNRDFVAEGDEAFVTPTDTDVWALSVYEAAEFAGGWGAEFGARIDDVALDNVVAGARDFSTFSASAGLHRHFEGGWYAGGQLSYSERAPSDVELFSDGAHLATQRFEIGDPGLDVESGVNLEGALRWTGDRVSFGANVFVASFEDFLYLDPRGDEEDGLPVFLYRQTGADFVGGEVYASGDFDGGGALWSWTASVDFVDGDLDGGGAVPFLPPVTVKAGLDADWNGLIVGEKTVIAGDQDEGGAGVLQTDGYATLDLSAAVDLGERGWGPEGARFFVQVRNVTDEEVRVATSVLKDLAPQPGRNIRIGLRAAF